MASVINTREESLRWPAVNFQGPEVETSLPSMGASCRVVNVQKRLLALDGSGGRTNDLPFVSADYLDRFETS